MEQISTLSGEHFPQPPFWVCPVVAAFARGYNEACAPLERQALCTWAAQALGSRASYDVELARERLMYLVVRALRRKLPILRRWRALRPLPKPPLRERERERLAATLAATLARRSDGHQIAVAVFDALLALGCADRLPLGPRPSGDQVDPTTGCFS
jgi:hypothetical protein